MSILKDSLKSAMSGKAFKALVVLGVLFVLAVIYLFGYFFTYQETLTSKESVSLQILNVKTLDVPRLTHRVYYKVNDNEHLYIVNVEHCVIKPKMVGTKIVAEKAYYSYTTQFNSGKHSRLVDVNNIFCVKQ